MLKGNYKPSGADRREQASCIFPSEHHVHEKTFVKFQLHKFTHVHTKCDSTFSVIILHFYPELKHLFVTMDSRHLVFLSMMLLQISLNECIPLVKKGKTPCLLSIICFKHRYMQTYIHPDGWRPPSGKSWIHHYIQTFSFQQVEVQRILLKMEGYQVVQFQ